MKPVLQRRRLRIERFLDISTGHVTADDMTRLGRPESGLCAYKYEYGAFVTVPHRDEIKALPALGYSPGFVAVLKAAQQAGCWFVRFDRDGFEYQQFPHYDW